MEENNQELLQQLSDQIKAELKLVNEEDMPVVYGMAQTALGLEQLEQTISLKVIAGLSIGDAIAAVENENNINRID